MSILTRFFNKDDDVEHENRECNQGYGKGNYSLSSKIRAKHSV